MKRPSCRLWSVACAAMVVSCAEPWASRANDDDDCRDRHGDDFDRLHGWSRHDRDYRDRGRIWGREPSAGMGEMRDGPMRFGE